MSSYQPWFSRGFIGIIFVMQMFVAVNPFPVSDKIVRLPGQPSVSFQQFSGYVTVDEKQQRNLFYYFVEAEKDPHSKPLVLWFNGGPGCSSVGVGAFTEHGPFIVASGKTIVKNKYSWNKVANMLYLESPAGVGFSYSANKSFYTHVDDAITAKDSLTFLQRWFGKFPEYKNSDFFIAGESYAGHYVPQLAYLLVDSKVNINLKGILIGNPALEFSTDTNSEMTYYWSHGLISESTYNLFDTVCDYAEFYKAAAIDKVDPPTACIPAFIQYAKERTSFIDYYFVVGNYCKTSINEKHSLRKMLENKALRSKLLENLSSSDSELIMALEDDMKGEDANYEDCIEEKAKTYLNRKDVQKALHARLVGVDEWKICSTKNLQYDRRDLYKESAINVVGGLVLAGIRAIVYSGDQDSVVPFLGTRVLVGQLAKTLGLKTTVPYSAWFNSKQVGGWTQVYGDKLTFATVRGASHGTPTSQPERSFLLFKSFLQGKPLPLEPK
ncbi:Serine carboxypeptidase-like [Trema orientale]|uniref:Carboxypeptidase n=1 Tax=Trema orientale TaxID=63057 RepID=A0A2P5FRR7_TREOI|nr:Serine carboxypeptidase-like [Trema orientale]